MRLDSHGFVPVEGADLRYVVAGHGRPTVILHGGPGLGFEYLRRELIGLLGDSHQLLFYDQRGSGRSTGRAHPAMLTMATFVQDLEAVRSAAGLERLHLLGHSFGGLLAMHYAIAHPGRVASLVLVDSDPASWSYWVEHRRIVEARCRAEDREALAALESSPGWGKDPALTERYLRIHWKTYFANGRVPDDLALDFDDDAQANFAITPRAIREDLGPWDIHYRLRQVTCPALVMYGRESIFPARAGEALREWLPAAALEVLENVGHFPPHEAGDTFAESIRNFRDRDPQ